MRKINPKLRAELAADPWYSNCCFPDKTNCQGRVEYHHACIYQGRQCDEKWAIVPLCHYHHKSQEGRDFAELLAITLMSEEDKLKYPKRDWNQRAAALFYKLTN